MREALALHDRSGQVLQGGQRRSPWPDEQAQVLTCGSDLDGLVVEHTSLDRPLDSELAEQTLEECPPDLSLLLERHTFGHVLCLLRFLASLCGYPGRGARRPRPVPSTFGRTLGPGSDRSAIRRLAPVLAAACRSARTRSGSSGGRARPT